MTTTGKNAYQAYQREKIMDVLDEATEYLSAEEIAEAAWLGSQCVRKHLQRLSETGMCHSVWHPAKGRRGRVFLYRKGRINTGVVRDPILSALMWSAV